MSIRPLNEDDLLVFSLKTELAKDLRNIIIKYHLPHIKQQSGNAHFLVTNKYSLQNALNTYLVKLDKRSDNTEEVITKEQINNLNELKNIEIHDMELFARCISFLDAFKIPLNRLIASHTPPSVRFFLKEYDQEITDAKWIRNDVDHEEPIPPNDREFFRKLAGQSPKEFFPLTHSILENIEEKMEYFRELTKPIKWDEGFSHNVPYPPEHESTGLLGRDSEVSEIMSNLERKTGPVVSIVGNAGVGKTAIAQEVAINFIKQGGPFDLILWYSFKDHTLTKRGVTEIQGLKTIQSIISNDLDEIEEYQDELAPYDYDDKDFFEWIESKETLIILDNLETIQRDPETEKFIYELMKYSRLIVTTRFQSNMFGIPHRIQKFNERNSVDLFRAYSKSMNIEKVLKRKDEELSLWSKKLDFNPLWIKSFCNLILKGEDPNFILSDIVRHTDFAEYSYKRNYEELSEQELNLLKIIYNCLVEGYLDKQTILNIYRECFEKNIQTEALLNNLNHLVALNFLDWNAFQLQEVQLSKFAKEWLSKKSEVTGDFILINKATQKYASMVQTATLAADTLSKTDWNHFEIRSQEESHSAEALQQAVNKLREAIFARKKMWLDNGNYSASVTNIFDNSIKVQISDFVRQPHIPMNNISQDLIDGLKVGSEIIITVKKTTDANERIKMNFYYDNKNSVPDTPIHEKLIAEAIEIAQSANEINPGYFETERVLALIKNYSPKHIHASRDHYEKAIDLEPDEAKNYYYFAYFLDDLGNSKLAIENFKKAYTRDPDDVSFSVGWAEKMSDPIESIELYLDTLEKADLGSRDMHKLTSSIFKSLRKNIEFKEIDTRPTYLIPIFNDLFEKLKGKYNSDYFDLSGFYQLLGFLKIYLEIVKKSRLEGAIYDGRIILEVIESIEYNFIKKYDLQKPLVLLFDYISKHFPDLKDDFLSTNHVALNLDRKLLLQRKQGRIEKRGAYLYVIDQKGSQYQFKTWDFSEAMFKPVNIKKFEGRDVLFNPSTYQDKLGRNWDCAELITPFIALS